MSIPQAIRFKGHVYRRVSAAPTEPWMSPDFLRSIEEEAAERNRRDPVTIVGNLSSSLSRIGEELTALGGEIDTLLFTEPVEWNQGTKSSALEELEALISSLSTIKTALGESPLP